MFWFWILTRPLRRAWSWRKYKPPSFTHGVVLVVIALCYDPAHPWSGLIAGALVYPTAAMILMLIDIHSKYPTKEKHHD